MNCQLFEAIINDLAREQAMDAATRESGLAHARDCARCAARLADEKTLTAGLRKLAERAKTEQSPARVEAVEALLLAAFRESRAAASNQAVAPLPALGHRWSRQAQAAAATVLLVLALAAILFGWMRSSEPSQQARDVKRDMKSERPELAPSPREDEASLHALPALSNEGEQKPYLQPARNRKLDNANHQRATMTANTDKRNRRAVASGDRAEIATSFLPLGYEYGFPQVEGGQVVRVELPRSALASFGLPMNINRADERIKADVLVGHDGLARAIRFIR